MRCATERETDNGHTPARTGNKCKEQANTPPPRPIHEEIKFQNSELTRSLQTTRGRVATSRTRKIGRVIPSNRVMKGKTVPRESFPQMERVSSQASEREVGFVAGEIGATGPAARHTARNQLVQSGQALAFPKPAGRYESRRGRVAPSDHDHGVSRREKSRASPSFARGSWSNRGR
jgi:hypothetical protein